MQNNRPLIRPMEDRDLQEVSMVESKCFASPWTIGMLEDELNNPNTHYLVVEHEGQVAGYAGFWKIIDEGHITNVAVSPEFRGLGYGKALILAMIHRAIELDIIAMTLEVRVSNIKAISLYEGFGFISAGVRKKYYQDNNEDALIMWLRLEPPSM